jgi:glycosyltransferase involved in cell wall biosynthesis
MCELRSECKIVVLMPVFDDWDALRQVLPRLDKALSARGLSANVLLVDDASGTLMPADIVGHEFSALARILRLRLRRNLGHQRAIATGLVYTYLNLPCEAVVLMDSDGEDLPEDVPVLLDKFYEEGQRLVIFAERYKRAEGLVFRTLYQIYRGLHWILVGIKVRVGNFSVIPSDALASLVVIGEVWNHYAAAVFKARIPYMAIRRSRGGRLAGKSKMNFPSLVAHGLSAMSVFGEVVGARLLAVSALTIVLVSVAFLGIGGHAVFTGAPIPGWMMYAAGLVLVILLQAVIMSFLLAFFTVESRSQSRFIPLADCPQFIGRMDEVFRANA